MTASLDQPSGGQMLSDSDWEVSEPTTTLPRCATLLRGTQAQREFRVPFGQGVFVVMTPQDPPRWIEPTVQSLLDVLNLPPNWDTYGASPVSPGVADAAMNLALSIMKNNAPAPSVVPTSRGGIQFEWHLGGVDLEVEFLSAVRVRGFFEDARTGLTWEQDLTFDLTPLVEAIARLSRSV